ncbi:helix-turn-helix domain-containing protein [Kitasatospora sp. NPDC047058]|uniref:helix-turn-helix domain-containing protein n=1 Tax=Kitasatospora sp. NPDC047058 TaxID=3155620 RepID=UPI003403C173
MLTVKEVADRLGVSPSTVYRWVDDDVLPATRKRKPSAVKSKRNLRGSIEIDETHVIAIENEHRLNEAA